MESPTLIAAAIVTVIAALGGVIVQVINAASASKDRREAARERLSLAEKTNAIIKTGDDTRQKTDTLLNKTTEIHALTNSQLSTVTAALAVANQKIEGLEKLIVSLIEARTVAAKTLAETPRRVDALHRTTDAHTPQAVTVVNTAADAVPVTRVDDVK
jgi:septal ring factor EnvC (AmiA/AmiB activator)